ncbi:glutamate racemase [Marinitenerispora sediminis]|uniref:Glutamate racemase n=1 Tax=Marinitenerispora sediminis TaxID=1931232 RepID=A0A368T5H8_9ACTN|nr:aspartate/glutamate racemase family protein [Marinitenerispora sediminis]RCV52405.1 glutamate racemase [Marinitenerispora sediminis]RCV53905.1 glutamate racemase [Marinitenerispora sediminis]RCV58613.1 glutamate racemase [Marinitenerispora sediminis]
MRIALIDSGIGLLSTAAALREARPDADLVLSMDPDHMPWGPRTAEEIIARALAGARAALADRPDAVVVACNTASVHALEALRAELEPETPVVGTVPAVKPAADRGEPFAIWATPATSGSPYQRDLIRRFANGVPVTPVPCDGLADAVDAADGAAIDEAVARAAARTPAEVRAVVLGCTHYDLVGDRISAALGHRPALFTAAGAVAAQTLRRLGTTARPEAARTGTLRVLASGRPGGLPPAALRYPAGALLAAAPAPTG